MSDKKAYVYDAASKTFNLERLNHELKASPLPPLSNGELQNPQIFGAKLYIVFDNALDAQQETDLDAIVTAHDGNLKSRTSKELQEKRERVFSELVDLAHFHPVLSVDDAPNQTGENVISDYLASIDDEINGWKRDGNPNTLINRITADAVEGQGNPFEKFLNTIVQAPSVKTFQFMIAYLPTTPYI